MDKNTIKKNFSRFAPYYDRYSSVQDHCASRLISKLGDRAFSSILDIGCGTGNYTALLRKRFPDAAIKALDISKDMVNVAERKLGKKNVEFSVKDAETINYKRKFDLISSNAVLQWFNNTKNTLANYSEMLTAGGIIAFSTFGPDTFRELDLSLKELFCDDISVIANTFYDKEYLTGILERFFRNVKAETEVYQEKYDSLNSLLKKIKYTGTRGAAANKNFWTKKMMGQLDKIYRRRFKEIRATYQVFYLRGVN